MMTMMQMPVSGPSLIQASASPWSVLMTYQMLSISDIAVPRLMAHSGIEHLGDLLLVLDLPSPDVLIVPERASLVIVADRLADYRAVGGVDDCVGEVRAVLLFGNDYVRHRRSLVLTSVGAV